MGRYNRDERRYDRDEPRGEDPPSAGRRHRFPWDDPAEVGESAPRTHDPPSDPDSRSSPTPGFQAESVPEEVSAGRPAASEALEDFPWQDSAGRDQAPQVWEEQPAEDSTSVGASAAASARGGERNSMAIAGFVCSLLMWIPFPQPANVLNLLLWVMALTFSSIGLSRSRKRGLPQKGFAIAGLCLSLIGVVFLIIIAILLVVGAISLFG